jgi:hypothetical protein
MAAPTNRGEDDVCESYVQVLSPADAGHVPDRGVTGWKKQSRHCGQSSMVPG